jgi:carboxyl-terminal processing protease
MQLRLNLKNPFKDRPIVSKIALSLSALIIFGVGIVLGSAYQKNLAPADATRNLCFEPPEVANTSPPETITDKVDFSVFWDAWALLQQKYVDRATLDYQKMVHGAIRGMLNSLSDPYTTFFDADESKEFRDEVSGKFQGIGVELAIKNNVLTVIAPLENTPAQRAGLQSKDQILAVGPTSTIGLSLEQCVSMIRGPQGTTVSLKIMRDTWTEPKDIDIERAVINVIGVTLEYPAPDIALIKIRNFYASSEIEFRKKALELLLSGKQKIIVDLRNNPGGYIDLAVGFSGWFLPARSTVLLEDNGAGKLVCGGCVTGLINGPLRNKQIVVLVDAGSASAAEIMAGALKDHLNAKLIGEQTFGKGSAQEVHQISSGASLKVTIAKWFTPNGINIDNTGLKPDLEIKNNPDSFDDAQLQKAIEVLENQ